MRRKSLLDTEHAIFKLLEARAYLDNKSDLSRNEMQLRARVSQLWQTELLRETRLTVRDEIENSLGYYRATFLREIPKLYADIEARLEGLRVRLFANGGLGRRRSRRQSQCNRGIAFYSFAHAKRNCAPFLSYRGA